MTLGRLIRYLGAESQSLIPTKWLTKIFLIGDVVAFLMQAAGPFDPHRLPIPLWLSVFLLTMTVGGGIMASGTIKAMDTGENITIAGLCVQLLFFSVFIITSAVSHFRIRKNPTPASREVTAMDWSKTTWKTIMLVLYMSSVLILIRSIFRLVEYVQGNSGYLISHEVFMYVFDSMLMFLTMIVMSVYHPSKLLGSRANKERVNLW